ncbi:hypothetical protein AX14_001582, partial [Amanita brunnescens Koide BX004]
LMLIGVYLNTYLFGINTSQFIAYYNSAFKDPLWMKSLVAFMAFIDIVHSISLMYLGWWFCITNYGNPDSLLGAAWPYSFTVIANAFIAVLTQIFLGYRIFSLTRSKIIFGFICFVAAVIFAIGMICGIRSWTIHVRSQVVELVLLETLTNCWLGLQSGLDLLITGTMVFRLYMSRTRFRQMNRVLVRLIAATIQTGIFCTIFAMGGLISYRALPSSNLFNIFGLPTGRIYTNTLMLTLNMRDALRDILSEPRVSSTFRITTSQSQSPSQLKEPENGPGLNLPVFNASTTTGETHSPPERQKSIVNMPSSLGFDSSEGGRKMNRAFELV